MRSEFTPLGHRRGGVRRELGSKPPHPSFAPSAGPASEGRASGAASGPQSEEPDPEDTVGVPEAQTRVRSEGDVKLMAKREVLQGEVTVRSPKGQ